MIHIGIWYTRSCSCPIVINIKPNGKEKFTRLSFYTFYTIQENSINKVSHLSTTEQQNPVLGNTNVAVTSKVYVPTVFLLRTDCKNIYIYIYIYIYTGCPRRNVPDFGRVFLMLNYTDITQNTYIQSWTFTEIIAREVWNFDSCYTLTDYQIRIEPGRNMWFL